MPPFSSTEMLTVDAASFWLIACFACIGLQKICEYIFDKSKDASEVEKFTHRLTKSGLWASEIMGTIVITSTIKWIAIPIRVPLPKEVTQSAGWIVIFWSICVIYLAFHPLIDRFFIRFSKTVRSSPAPLD